MAVLTILNPRGKRKMKRRRKVKMTAKQLKFFGPRKGKKKKKAKAKRRAKSKVIIVTSNPKGSTMAKSKRRHRRRKAKVFSHNPKRRRFRRNPRSEAAGFVNNTLVPAAIGAAGAIGTDMLLSYLPIPPQFRSGIMYPVVKIAGALLVGMAVGAVSNRAAGEEAAAGAVIVTLYGLSKGIAFNAAGGMGRYAPMNRYAPMRRFNMRGIEAPNFPATFLQRPGGSGMGYMNPSRVAPPGQPNRAAMRYIASGGQ